MKTQILNKIIDGSLALLTVSLFTACTHADKKEEVAAERAPACEQRDWFQIGKELGTRGTTFEIASQTNPDCSNDEKDMEALVTGYHAGLLVFCAPEQALFLGKRGQNAPDVCPTSLEAPFRKAYDKGRQIYDLEQDNERIALEIENVFEQMNAPSLPPSEKSLIEKNLESLRNKKKQNATQMGQLEKETISL